MSDGYTWSAVKRYAVDEIFPSGGLEDCPRCAARFGANKYTVCPHCAAPLPPVVAPSPTRPPTPARLAQLREAARQYYQAEIAAQHQRSGR
jgi:hypothetical protein